MRGTIVVPPTLSSDGTLKRIGVTAIAVLTAHALAWGVGLYMAFGPVYPAGSPIPMIPGEPLVRMHSVTLVEEYGLWVLWLLLIPVLLSGVALLAIRFADAGSARRKALLWVAALALLALCAVGIFSIGVIDMPAIGVFYLPSALGLLAAAVGGSVTGSPDAESQASG